MKLKKPHFWVWCEALLWKENRRPAKRCFDCGATNQPGKKFPRYCGRKVAGK